MGHDHHHCECKHARIKFCAKCNVPHCLDCGMEWTTKPVYPGWYYTVPNYTIPNVWCGNATSDSVTITSGTSTLTSGLVGSILTGSLADPQCQH